VSRTSTECPTPVGIAGIVLPSDVLPDSQSRPVYGETAFFEGRFPILGLVLGCVIGALGWAVIIWGIEAL
jgi:hypothetical protein